VKESVDEKGNLIFEINSKKIIISISKLRILMGANILSVFGRMKSLSGRICDDGEATREKNKKEGSIRLNLKRIVDAKDKNSVVQRKIIETLSHEARHIAQPQYENRLLKFRRKAYMIFLLPLLIISILDIIVQISFLIIRFNAPIYLIIILIFFPTFFVFIFLSYLSDPEEKDAREFASKAIKDKRWLEIVQVETIK